LLGEDGRIIKLISWKQVGRTWTGFICLGDKWWAVVDKVPKSAWSFLD
jgi:hypothetical protein